ncbi:MAG: outer membrane lipoprotein-sorting protein [Bacteroides sp.]
MKKVWGLATLLLLALAVSAQDGAEIMRRMKDRPNGETRTAEVELRLVNKRGSERVRKLKSYSKDVGVDVKSIMFFMHPGDVKGTGFLTWDYDNPKQEDDKWLYLPAMKKVRRISSSSAKKDYFMGTDFTYDDMGSRNVEEDTHKLLREEELDGQKCWVIESVPVNKGEIYSRKVLWIRQDALMPLRVEYYDRLDKLHRLLTVQSIKKIGDFWAFEKETMENVQTGHKTVISFSAQTFDTKLDDDLFTVNRLERGV